MKKVENWNPENPNPKPQIWWFEASKSENRNSKNRDMQI